jgi:serine/threonine-protein kinase
VTLHFVPGGKVILPENFGPESGKWVEVTPFYMDETEVTNHQYVEFLNQVLPQISVEKGVVQGEGTIWLLLGEAVEGYEPIVFHDGYFHITDPAHASCPVIRVTPYGAAAYAAFYGKRLPTDREWLHAMKGGSGQPKGAPGVGSDTSGKTGANAMMDGMHHPKEDQIKSPAPISPEPPGVPTPVIVFEPNGYGIRGLNAGVKEWGMRMLKEPSGEKMEYVILGEAGSDSEKGDTISAPVSRYPWEAFEEVGFRCVLDVSSKGK